MPLRLHQLPECGRQVPLHEDLSSLRCFALFSQMREKYPGRVLPLLDLILLPFDAVGCLRLDRITIGHLNCGCEHLLQRKRSVRSQHRHQTTGSARRDSRKGTVLGWSVIAARAIELRRGTGRCDTKCVDADDLLELRMVYQRLGLSTP